VISDKRRALAPSGTVRYPLKTPYRDGTTHVIFEPLDFIARLAALVPKVSLTRDRGEFAPNSQHRALVRPARQGKGNARAARRDVAAQTPAGDEPVAARPGAAGVRRSRLDPLARTALLPSR